MSNEVADKVKRTTEILDAMDREICFRLNRGFVLMEMSDRELGVIEKFLKTCDERRR